MSGAWLLGLLAGQVSGLSSIFAVFALVPLALIFFIHRRRRLLILCSLCIVVFFAGVYYLRSTQSAARNGDLNSFNNLGVVEIRGIVSGDPETGPDGARIRLSSTAIRRLSEWQPVSGAALLIVPRYPAYRYGDELVVSGELQGRPQGWAGSSNQSAYWDYLANHDVFSTLFYPDVELAARDQGPRLCGGCMRPGTTSVAPSRGCCRNPRHPWHKASPLVFGLISPLTSKPTSFAPVPPICSRFRGST